MKYSLSCRIAGVWGFALLCGALKKCLDMGNLWTDYWKSFGTCLIQSAEVSKRMDLFIFHLKSTSFTQVLSRRVFTGNETLWDPCSW
jgi:hypothetical protein